MFNIIKKELEWGGRALSLETGKIARQADGSIVATYEGTTVLATVVYNKSPQEGINFLPLTVNYREMAFAAGKIPGGFLKREGRPSEKETLVSRLIDRPIRPLFPDYFFNETQITCTVLSHDLKNDPDIVAMIAAGTALAISGAPINKNVAGVRVGLINDEFILNPTIEQISQSKLDLIVAGTSDSILMVESEAKELSEEQMLAALEFGHSKIKEIITVIEQFAQEIGKDKFAIPSYVNEELDKKVNELASKALSAAYTEKVKQVRYSKIKEVEKMVVEKLATENSFSENLVRISLGKFEYNLVRSNILNTNLRIDGRKPEDIRQINTEISILSKTHGSALFTRGETQALAVTTLGTSQDEQIIDALEGESKAHFLLHYNFPAYSVGEVAPMKSPGRREIGHGKLAWRALNAVLPEKSSFPYTIRIVSEVTESNGSSSMATVCGASLSLMDAGVPIKSPVAGIAMGLILENKKYVILSDIMGDEDHLGDMDFKVAGTNQGITALQMDIKIEGITIAIMDKALSQAKEGRAHILQKMNETISESKQEISHNAPTITTIKINKDKIREVIGSGGKVIRSICEASGAKVEIDDDGTVRIAAVNNESSIKALALIESIVLEPEIGKIYTGKVVKIAEFGAFVNFLGSRDGLVHISEISTERVNKVEDVLQINQEVKVKVLEIDNRGKIKLSMRCVNQTDGTDIQDFVAPVKNSPSSSSGGGSYNDSRSSKPASKDIEDRGSSNRERSGERRSNNRSGNNNKKGPSRSYYS